MIISHKHKFVFLCLPRTGTTAIREELCELYGGEKILYKHAPYDVFLRQASEEEKKYKVIVSVRNPLDRTVSLYFKYMSNHDGIQKDQIKSVGNKNIIQKGGIALANKILKKRASSVAGGKMTFPEFIKEFYSMPYSDWHSMYYDRYDYIIRFEHLSDDFTKALKTVGITPIRELPVINVTKKDKKSFVDQYTKEIIPIAQRAFYTSMKLYGYPFPESWPKYLPSAMDKIKYHGIHSLRKIYWKYIR
ncbi:sulfotransferase family 2 domain-containing protein [Echinicola sp. CAU 1574]|uniref:Sulfotransferase family 2 domain-containing protein n=1 Tax=Echinicola arenosa TaxID=2774144 RepID=A0ABR9AM98_9BACT|nr:sulfotransferase family 2 domain-containing protein [Echinicola arenosa]MBD8488749.1 sulfotransferase family 2 domain-containing protein [Echinicola arenosa]